MASSLDFENATHILLQKQLEKITKENDGQIELNKLIACINESYEQFDKEKRFIERSMMIMSEELTSSNESLKEQTIKLKESQDRYELAAEGSNDGLWDWEIDTNKCYYSTRWREMLGFNEQDVLYTSEDWLERIHPDHIQGVTTAIGEHLAGKTSRFQVEYQILTKQKNYVWMQVRGVAACDKNGKPMRIAGSQTDISERKAQEGKLFKAAFYDKLTDLPNRELFLDRLHQAAKRMQRLGSRPAALLFLDLDRFKIINDTMGHEAGDALLINVAKRLKRCLRPGDTVSRLGGDEFTILLHEIEDENHANEIANRILEEISYPQIIYEQEIYVTASIGAVLINESDMKPETILRNADLAMYRAKNLGKARAEVFDKSQFDSVMSQLNVEMDLRGGLERGEFVVYYQPIIDLSTNKITSLEALVRWLNPDKGIIPPGNFISVAEENGLIVPLGAFVLHSTCDQIKKWQKSLGDDQYPTVCVNISVKQLSDHKNVEEIINIFESYELSPGSVKLEVTESIIMDNSKHISKQLYRLREKGFELSIDDFGTGYSALRYLHTFPFNYLKIDRSFVSRINFDEKTLKLVASIIHIAHDMGMKAVAEGIETENELEILKELNCDFGQGFYFSKPLPATDITRIIVAKQIKTHQNDESTVDIPIPIDMKQPITLETTL